VTPEPVTGEAPVRRAAGRPASLRSRLLLTFMAVTVTAIALVTTAAVIGTDRGLSAQQDADRRELAARTAASLAEAYQRAGGWDAADLGPAILLATSGNARLVVRDPTGGVVVSTAGQGRMSGMGGPGPGSDGMGGNGSGTPVLVQVVVAGSSVGSVTLIFPGSAQTVGRPVAWRWVWIAALAAVALAAAAAWSTTRMLTRPLAVLTATARAFAAGDLTARTRLSTPGELGELAAAFDDAAEQVQLSERARRQMSADVAHELRTPLAALQAGLEELRDGFAPADPAALARLHDQTLRLGRVVADLAELSAADAARLTLRPEPVDLVLVARESAAAHEAPLRAAGLSLTCHLDEPAGVLGDAGRLHQVVGNLLRNCAQHCRAGDKVRVAIEHDGAGRTVRLTVCDTGPGIPPEDLPHVFTRFWHAGDGSGSGLGMAIVRSIVEAHGGTVGVRSEGGLGTCVTVELPTAAAEPDRHRAS
jgi:two-component system sensor histidine kinase BaeS